MTRTTKLTSKIYSIAGHFAENKKYPILERTSMLINMWFYRFIINITL